MTEYTIKFFAPFAALSRELKNVIHWNHPSIWLALIVVMGLANIIILAIASTGRLSPCVDGVTREDICLCPCHERQMFPGMVCQDCWGKVCGDSRAFDEEFLASLGVNPEPMELCCICGAKEPCPNCKPVIQ